MKHDWAAGTRDSRGEFERQTVSWRRCQAGFKLSNVERPDVPGAVMVDTAIFLGAGASKAEGAPLQGELFRE